MNSQTCEFLYGEAHERSECYYSYQLYFFLVVLYERYS
nr:MAG TPA: hypothetical protein [Crassvirales sp.]